MKRLLLAILLFSGVRTASAVPGTSVSAAAAHTVAADPAGYAATAPAAFPAATIPAASGPAASGSTASVCAAPVSAPAASANADSILEKITAGFRALGAYGVEFEVTSDEYAARGRYAVEGEKYYLVLGDAEVYCDGAVRYEVDNRRREVTIDEVDTSSRNILNNPVRAFDFIGSEYAASLVGGQEGRAVILLTPTPGNNSPAGTITLTVDTDAMRPVSLAYDYDGERVSVAVLGIAPLASAPKSFAKGSYAGYEFIDFR